MQHTLAVSHKQQDKLKELTLDQIAGECILIDRNSKLKYGFLLLEARTRFSADQEFGSWRSKNFLGLDMAQASTLMNLARFFSSLPMAEIPVSVGYMLSAPKNVESGVSDQAYKEIIEHNDGKISIKEAKEIISKYGGSNPDNVHVGNNSGENEWYTPKEFITSAIQVMGCIDLDPASSALANATVGAKNIYTKHDSGLDKDWYGNVWMNPPYAQPLMSQFAEKMAQSCIDGDINQAIVLVNNATETAWFQIMSAECSAICFPEKRIKFIDTDGNSTGAPLQGQAILYFGSRFVEFNDIFSSHGMVVYHEIH